MIEINDLKNRFGQNEINELSQQGIEINEIILDSIDFIESFLFSRYKLPFSVVPPSIKSCLCDIVRYKLYKFEKPPEVISNYQDAIGFLDKISKGRVNLKIDQAVDPNNQIKPIENLSLDTMIYSVKRRFTDKNNEYTDDSWSSTF